MLFTKSAGITCDKKAASIKRQPLLKINITVILHYVAGGSSDPGAGVSVGGSGSGVGVSGTGVSVGGSGSGVGVSGTGVGLSGKTGGLSVGVGVMVSSGFGVGVRSRYSPVSGSMEA